MKKLMRAGQQWVLRRGKDELRVPEAPAMTIESGSFTHGICPDCEWAGPARRARNVAVEDAELHRLAGCGVDVSLAQGQRTESPARNG